MSSTLHKTPTMPPKHLDKKKIKKENEKMIQKIQEYQYKMYAEGERSMLIILQWLDASGKDGVVRYIFSGMNPLGCRAISFKKPTAEEYAHDFLWRIHKQCPAKGMVQIFNRSHYEDVIVPVVTNSMSKDIIKERYEQINDFEKMLKKNDTVVLKFYLHVSPDAQKERLEERIIHPQKHWKHKIADRDTREHFNQYLQTYSKVFDECNKPEWHIIPADKNWYKINQIAKAILKAFEEMNLKWPELPKDVETKILQKRVEIEEEKRAKKEALAQLTATEKATKRESKKVTAPAKKATPAKKTRTNSRKTASSKPVVTKK